MIERTTPENINNLMHQHNVIHRFLRWFRIRILKTRMYNLECDMMFFAIPFSQYEREMEVYQKELDYLSNGN